MAEEFVTTNQAAEIIGCSPQHVRLLISEGRLTAKKIDEPNKAKPQWRVLKVSARSYAKVQPRKGWPRGKKRI